MVSIINSSRWLLAISMTLVFASQAFGHGMSEAEKQVIIAGGNLRYIWIGASHMLSGFDHLAFVFGIIFFLTKLREIVEYITAFTLGHSITLIFATFTTIQVNYFLIDAVIALSVCYIAFHNLGGIQKYFDVEPPNMLAMIFGFGLIHGLGLSTRLQQLPLNEDQLLLNIISFNVGIELGQIAALALMLLLLAAFRKSHGFPTFSKISNAVLVAVGAVLFFVQMHGYEHSTNSEEFAASVGVAERPVKLSTVNPNTAWKDTISVTIPAGGEIEYKLRLANDATLEYSWKTDDGELNFDFHGEPAGDTTGYFMSYQKGASSSSQGALTTIFDGAHGWYWQNTRPFPVKVTLKLKGEYQLPDFKAAFQLVIPTNTTSAPAGSAQATNLPAGPTAKIRSRDAIE